MHIICIQKYLFPGPTVLLHAWYLWTHLTKLCGNEKTISFQEAVMKVHNRWVVQLGGEVASNWQ